MSPSLRRCRNCRNCRALTRVLTGWQTPVVVVNAIHPTDRRVTPRVRALIAHLRAAYA